jgi:hypothetical protein
MTIYTRFLHISSLAAAVFALAGTVQAREVLLRNTDGKSLSARLMNLEGDKLSVMRESDKKIFSLALSQLDEASRNRVDEWIKDGGNLSEQYEIEVSTAKSNKRSEAEEYDDRAINLEPVIVIKNPDTKRKTKGGELTVVFLGRPINDRSGFFVYSKESFELSSIDTGKQEVFQMKKIRHTYDDRGYAKYGARYLGWVALIHDEEGEAIISGKSVPSTLVDKYGIKLLKLRTELQYDKDLKLMKNVPTYVD